MKTKEQVLKKHLDRSTFDILDGFDFVRIYEAMEEYAESYHNQKVCEQNMSMINLYGKRMRTSSELKADELTFIELKERFNDIQTKFNDLYKSITTLIPTVNTENKKEMELYNSLHSLEIVINQT